MNTFRQMGFQSVIVKRKLEPCKCNFHFVAFLVVSGGGLFFLLPLLLIKLHAILSMNV